MMRFAIEQAQGRRRRLVQLTSNKARADAHRFYERLGFVHEPCRLQDEARGRGSRLLPLPSRQRNAIRRLSLRRRGSTMKKFLLQFFTWWNGQTLGTRLHTWRFGKQRRPGRVRQRLLRRRHRFGRPHAPLGDLQRLSEASAIPPGWHGWMHHRVDTPPASERLQAARVAEAARAEPDRHRRAPTGRKARC